MFGMYHSLTNCSFLSPKLELSDNKISDGLEALIDCPELEEVILVGNKVSDLTKLRPLVSAILM